MSSDQVGSVRRVRNDTGGERVAVLLGGQRRGQRKGGRQYPSAITSSNIIIWRWNKGGGWIDKGGGRVGAGREQANGVGGAARSRGVSMRRGAGTRQARQKALRTVCSWGTDRNGGNQPGNEIGDARLVGIQGGEQVARCAGCACICERRAFSRKQSGGQRSCAAHVIDPMWNPKLPRTRAGLVCKEVGKRRRRADMPAGERVLAAAGGRTDDQIK